MAKKKSVRWLKNAEASPMRAMLYGCIAGTLGCIAVFSAGLFAASAFALNNPDPSLLYGVLGMGISVLSGFAGGVISARISKGAELSSSLIFGIAMAVIAFVVALLFPDGSKQAMSSFLFLIFPVSAILGGLAGKPKKSKKKKFSIR